jgi:type II secretory pathway pseudopilin PulG
MDQERHAEAHDLDQFCAQAVVMRRTAKRLSAYTLLELLVSMSLFGVITLITFVLYDSARLSISRSSQRIESRQLTRAALQRVTPLLTAAYPPPITNYSKAFDGGNSGALSYNPSPSPVPVDLATKGQDSVIFYAPGDLLDIHGPSELYPVNSTATVPFINAVTQTSPKLYELRLDPAAGYDVPAGFTGYTTSLSDGSGVLPALVLRNLVLRQMYIPDHSTAYASVQYLYLPTPTDPEGISSPVATTPTRIIASRLLDVRFTPIGQTGTQVQVASQYRTNTLVKGVTNVTTDVLNTTVYFLTGQ